MRIRDIILLEAKPSGLGQGMLDKLFDTYSIRDINDNLLGQKFEDGMQIAEYLFKFVGPKNLPWVAKQYTVDQGFFLHDLGAWKNTFDEFDKLSRDRRIDIEKNLSKYKSITDLRKIIEELSGHQDALGSKFFSKAVSGLEPYFESGDADLLYRGSDYIIYHPISFESSSVLDKGKLIGSVNLCTVMNGGYFEQYNSKGYLIYIISQDRMYNCYINTGDDKASEFADQQNDHGRDLQFLLAEFPQLKDIIAGIVTGITDANVLSEILSVDQIKDMIKDNGRALSAIPSERRDYDICLEALSVTPNEKVLALIPAEFWQRPKLYKIIIDNELITSENINNSPEPIQVQWVQKDPDDYIWIDKPSELVTDALIRSGNPNMLISRLNNLTERNAYTLVSHHDGWLPYLVRYRPELVTPKIEIAAIDATYRKEIALLGYVWSTTPTRTRELVNDVKSPQGKKHLAILYTDIILTYIQSGGNPAKLGGISNDMFNSVFSDFVTKLHLNSRDQQNRSYISSSLDTFINLFISYLTKPQLDTLKKLAADRKLVLDAMPNIRDLVAPSNDVDPELYNQLMRIQNKNKPTVDDELDRVKELAERLNR